MIETIYVEEEVLDHPTSQHVRQTLPQADWVIIRHYQELFNKRHQNFRLQKHQPKLILAKKHSNFVLPVPSGFGMNAKKNFYFSHMYNCLYDCKYCFLQGLYSSANLVLFVNYKDFFHSILELKNDNQNTSMTFFSGYDCDSLAFDKVSGFADQALNFFSQHPEIELELRTKSISASALFNREPISNCIVAFSLMPAEIAFKLDHNTPSISRRVNMIEKLANHGWRIGIRFDPLIHVNGWENLYNDLFQTVFKNLEENHIHSVSFGPLRFPKNMYKKIEKFYPQDKFYAFPMEEKKGYVSYGNDIEARMHQFIKTAIGKYVKKTKIFQCVIK